MRITEDQKTTTIAVLEELLAAAQELYNESRSTQEFCDRGQGVDALQYVIGLLNNYPI